MELMTRQAARSLAIVHEARAQDDRVGDAPHAVAVRGAAHLQELPVPVLQLLSKHHLHSTVHRVLQWQIRGLPGPLLDVPRPAQRIRTCTVTLLCVCVQCSRSQELL